MKREGVLLFVLALVQFTHIMDFMIIMPLANILQEGLTITTNQFSYLVSVYTFSAGIIGFLGVFFLDKFDRKPALLITYIGFVAGTFACGLSQDYTALMVARTITGAFGGIQAALVLAIVSDIIPEHRRGKAIGIIMSAFSAAAVLGVPFGLYITTLFDWHAPFFFIGGLGILITIACFFFIPSMKGHIQQEKRPILEPLKIVFSDKNMLLALLFTFLLICGQFTVIPFIADYMQSNIGFSDVDLIYMYSIGGGLTVFTMPLFGKLADKYGKPLVFTIFGILVIIPIFFTTQMEDVSITTALVVTSIFFIIVSGRTVPATSMVTSVVTPQHRGSFMSVRTSVQQFASSIAALIAGLIVLKDTDGFLQHYELVGYISIALSLGAVAVGRMLKVVD